MPTKIEWAEETWNPVTGCTKVSPGCKNCYAEGIAERFRGTPAFPNGFDLTLKPDRLDQPSRWRKPRRIFVNSMSDLFHEDIDLAFLSEVYHEMFRNPRHEYLILTKRAERMARLLGISPDPRNPWGKRFGHTIQDTPNIWHGVSVENQHWAEERIPYLLQVPSAIRFLSCEPLLGPLDLSEWLPPSDVEYHPYNLRPPVTYRINSPISWVIVGGESGPRRRPMEMQWARSIRDQCADAGVPFFMKQIDKVIEIPDDLLVRQYPQGATS